MTEASRTSKTPNWKWAHMGWVDMSSSATVSEKGGRDATQLASLLCAPARLDLPQGTGFSLPLIHTFGNHPEKTSKAETLLNFFLEGQTKQSGTVALEKREMDGNLPQTPGACMGMTGGLQLNVKTFPVIRVRGQQEG